MPSVTSRTWTPTRIVLGNVPPKALRLASTAAGSIPWASSRGNPPEAAVSSSTAAGRVTLGRAARRR